MAALLAAKLFLVPDPVRADLWCTGYFPGWKQSAMPASNIDFSVVSHVIHFSLVPNANGTLNSSENGITTDYALDVVAHAHAAGRKALICVGGAETEPYFQGATSSGNLALFITGLTNFMASCGYDGIDLDWEPLPSSDAQLYTNFVRGLRAALNGFAQHKLLTAAVGAYPPYGDPPTAQYTMFAALQGNFDQINIMTYDLSGPYPGWVTWFNSPIYDDNLHFPGGGGVVPSVNGSVTNFLAGGVAPGKLGIGIPFYGYVWSGGVTLPRQSWGATAPTVTAASYTEILSGYYQTNLYHWDTVAQAPYLGYSNANAANDMFISYDDERACQTKVSYARNHYLGGVMIWELAQDHQPNIPDPLLGAIKQALAPPILTRVQGQGANVTLDFPTAALGAYRLQWTSNPASGNWTSLLVTNIGGAGGDVQVIDSGVITNQSGRFYRIQTPP